MAYFVATIKPDEVFKIAFLNKILISVTVPEMLPFESWSILMTLFARFKKIQKNSSRVRSAKYGNIKSLTSADDLI